MSTPTPALLGLALVDRYALQLAVEALEHFDGHVHTGDGAQLLIDGSLHHLREALAQPADPLDTPLPCDITVGHGTHRRGVKLRSLVTRMQVLYKLAGLYGTEARDGISQAAVDVLAERQRQTSAEGYTPERDDKYVDGDLAAAAASYALVWPAGSLPMMWPWAPEHWKPRDERSNLVRAGALIQAEIERLDRAAAKEGGAA